VWKDRVEEAVAAALIPEEPRKVDAVEGQPSTFAQRQAARPA